MKVVVCENCGAKYQLNDMIIRDINRANVIIWSIANETPHGEAREKFLYSEWGHGSIRW